MFCRWPTVAIPHPFPGDNGVRALCQRWQYPNTYRVHNFDYGLPLLCLWFLLSVYWYNDYFSHVCVVMQKKEEENIIWKKGKQTNKENNSLIDSFKLSISLQKGPLIISFIHSRRYRRVKGQGHMSVKVSKLFGGEKQIYTHAYMLETPKSPKSNYNGFFSFSFSNHHTCSSSCSRFPRGEGEGSKLGTDYRPEEVWRDQPCCIDL